MSINQLTKDSSETKIAIVCTEALIEQIRDTLRAFPNLAPVFFNVTNKGNQQIEQFLVAIANDVEVILFTEYYYYNVMKDKMDLGVPVHYIPLMGTGLYRSLFTIKNSYNFKALSIDSVSGRYVEQTLKELGLTDIELHVYDANKVDAFDKMTQFHINNYENNGTIAITAIKDIADELNEHNVPYEWVKPTKQDMTVSLERALLATKTRRNKESQIVFGLVHVDNFSQVLSKYVTEHDVQLLKLKIQQMLLNYVKYLDGHLIMLGGEEYSFITTRGIFERETRGYKYIPLLKDAKSELGITFSLGIGFGLTAAEAGNHARLALSQSQDLGGNVCYIVREDRSVLGPVDVTSQAQYERYELSITDKKLLERSEQAGMSAAYMTKIMARVARHQKIDYTAQELASTLDVTVRSAHRILLKLMDANLVDIIGEEKLTHKGRPRRIYRLTFIDENNFI